MSSTWEDPKEAKWPEEAPGPTDVPTEDDLPTEDGDGTDEERDRGGGTAGAARLGFGADGVGDHTTDDGTDAKRRIP